MGISLPGLFDNKDYAFLCLMFQIRHIYAHNMGVVDEDFVRKLPDFSGQKGRKYLLKAEEIKRFLNILQEAGEGLHQRIQSAM